MIAASILIFVVIATTITIWNFICIQRTEKQRLRLINLWREPLLDPDQVRELMIEFHQVSFKQHNSALVWFKNPLKLYGPVTQTLA